MPNWVTNEIAIKKEDMKYLFNDNGEVDFNVICPMPKELERTVSGGVINECVMYYVFKTSKTKDEFFARCISEKNLIGHSYIDIKKSMTKAKIEAALLERIGDDLHMYNDEYRNPDHPKHTPMEIGEWYYNVRKKYGSTDWYEWSYKNWGVKWNASCTSIFEDGDLVCATFDTPWGPPTEILSKLAEKCPFYLEWEEEQGYHGEVYFDGNGFYEHDLDMFDYNFTDDGDCEKIGEEMFDCMKDNVLEWKMVA